MFSFSICLLQMIWPWVWRWAGRWAGRRGWGRPAPGAGGPDCSPGIPVPSLVGTESPSSLYPWTRGTKGNHQNKNIQNITFKNMIFYYIGWKTQSGYIRKVLDKHVTFSIDLLKIIKLNGVFDNNKTDIIKWFFNTGWKRDYHTFATLFSSITEHRDIVIISVLPRTLHFTWQKIILITFKKRSHI